MDRFALPGGCAPHWARHIVPRRPPRAGSLLMGHGAGATTPGPQGPPSEPRFSETAAYSGEIPRRDPSDVDGAASRAAGIAGPEVHRFRVLRPHARGGLGMVSVALDAD